MQVIQEITNYFVVAMFCVYPFTKPQSVRSLKTHCDVTRSKYTHNIVQIKTMQLEQKNNKNSCFCNDLSPIHKTNNLTFFLKKQIHI